MNVSLRFAGNFFFPHFLSTLAEEVLQNGHSIFPGESGELRIIFMAGLTA